MDFVGGGYHGVGCKRVLATPHAWERVAGLGSRQIVPAARLRFGPPERSGRKKTGVLARLIILRAVTFIYHRAACSVSGALGLFSLLCAGWSLKWASLQDRLGCSGAPLPAFLLQDCSTLMSFL